MSITIVITLGARKGAIILTLMTEIYNRDVFELMQSAIGKYLQENAIPEKQFRYNAKHFSEMVKYICDKINDTLIEGSSLLNYYYFAPKKDPDAEFKNGNRRILNKLKRYVNEGEVQINESKQLSQKKAKEESTIENKITEEYYHNYKVAQKTFVFTAGPAELTATPSEFLVDIVDNTIDHLCSWFDGRYELQDKHQCLFYFFPNIQYDTKNPFKSEIGYDFWDKLVQFLRERIEKKKRLREKLDVFLSKWKTDKCNGNFNCKIITLLQIYNENGWLRVFQPGVTTLQISNNCSIFMSEKGSDFLIDEQKGIDGENNFLQYNHPPENSAEIKLVQGSSLDNYRTQIIPYVEELISKQPELLQERKFNYAINLNKLASNFVSALPASFIERIWFEQKNEEENYKLSVIEFAKKFLAKQKKYRGKKEVAGS